ncbi:hypothetical protein JCM8097_000352 [Rhodosporidiobolus ruineniae]
MSHWHPGSRPPAAPPSSSVRSALSPSDGASLLPAQLQPSAADPSFALSTARPTPSSRGAASIPPRNYVPYSLNDVAGERNGGLSYRPHAQQPPGHAFSTTAPPLQAGSAQVGDVSHYQRPQQYYPSHQPAPGPSHDPYYASPASFQPAPHQHLAPSTFPQHSLAPAYAYPATQHQHTQHSVHPNSLPAYPSFRSAQKRPAVEYDQRSLHLAAPPNPAATAAARAATAGSVYPPYPVWLPQPEEEEPPIPLRAGPSRQSFSARPLPQAAAFAPAIQSEALSYQFPPELSPYEASGTAQRDDSGDFVGYGFAAALTAPENSYRSSPRSFDPASSSSYNSHAFPSHSPYPPDPARSRPPPSLASATAPSILHASNPSTFDIHGSNVESSSRSRPPPATAPSSSRRASSTSLRQQHLSDAYDERNRSTSYDYLHLQQQEQPALAARPLTPGQSFPSPSSRPPRTADASPISHLPPSVFTLSSSATPAPSGLVLPSPSSYPSLAPSAFSADEALSSAAPLPPSTFSSSSAPSRPPPPPTSTASTPQSDTAFVHLAALRRKVHSTLPPPLSYKPARGSGGASAAVDRAATEAERERRRLREQERREVDRGRVNRNQAGGVTSLEVAVRCSAGGCGALLMARLVLRALSPAMLDALDAVEAAEAPCPPSAVVALEQPGARCWACIGMREGEEGVERADGRKAEEAAGTAREREAQLAVPSGAAPPVSMAAAAARPTVLGGVIPAASSAGNGYESTLSAAVDRLEGLKLGGEEEGGEELVLPRSAPREMEKEDWEDMLLVEEASVDESYRSEMLKCDVCALTCGTGTLIPSPSFVDSYSASSTPPFTVEVICARCDAMFKCCSDCGGGGGRLTPGRWRSRELFPDGRKTCKLSHARNPALGEVAIDVLPLSPTPPANLPALESRIRQIYFNSRLGTIARPEFLLRGDGLARSFAEVERVTIDHWSLMSGLLKEQPEESTGIKRYVTLMYSTPRKRHAKRGKAEGESSRSSKKEKDQVAFGFSITEADFNDGTLFFCCVMPWPINGQAFDAMTLLGESTTARVKSDLQAANLIRSESGLAPYPSLSFNYLVSPFKSGSRPNMGLARRGYESLDELLRKDTPGVRRDMFPPYKEVWLPCKYGTALTPYIRPLVSLEDLGGPPPENAPRKRAKKANAPPPPLPGPSGSGSSTNPATPAAPAPAVSLWPSPASTASAYSPFAHLPYF